MIGCRRKRTALTLVELLVVIVILTLLVAVVLPLAQPTPSQRLVREASRQVNAFLASAQARAKAEEREYGVLLIPDGSGERCFDLAMAKVPPVYAGDEVSAIAKISSSSARRATLEGADRIATSLDYDDPSNRFVGVDDRIRFNYRGPWYRINRIEAPQGVAGAPRKIDVRYEFDVDGDGTDDAPMPPTGAEYKYQIKRKPRASAAGTMTLPTGSYIDLSVSGEGIAQPPIVQKVLPSGPIMFDAKGRLKSDSIYLLVGSMQPQTGLGATPAAEWITSIRNLLVDAPSIWVAVNGSSGRISTAANVAQVSVDPGVFAATVIQADGTSKAFDLTDEDERLAAWNAAVAASRASAISGPTVGGR